MGTVRLISVYGKPRDSHGGQYADDRDDHKEFYECKSLLARHKLNASLVSLGIGTRQCFVNPVFGKGYAGKGG